MRTRNKIISGLLILLGFSACLDELGDPGINAPEYGVPIVEFSVKGRVTDDDEKPIKGIRVVIRPTDPEALPNFVNDTIYTDASGIYQSRSDMSLIMPGFTAVAADIDGPANGGEFRPAESAVTVEDMAGTDNGNYLIVKDFMLKKKTEENDEK